MAEREAPSRKKRESDLSAEYEGNNRVTLGEVVRRLESMDQKWDQRFIAISSELSRYVQVGVFEAKERAMEQRFKDIEVLREQRALDIETQLNRRLQEVDKHIILSGESIKEVKDRVDRLLFGLVGITLSGVGYAIFNR